MELLDKFSHHVRVTKIDQKYKEQYLDTIKQLVQEQVSINTTYKHQPQCRHYLVSATLILPCQVRTQTYMSRLVSERDQLMADINRLTTRLQGASMDQVECSPMIIIPYFILSTWNLDVCQHRSSLTARFQEF